MTTPDPGLLDEAAETTTHTEPVDVVAWQIESNGFPGRWTIWPTATLQTSQSAVDHVASLRRSYPERSFRVVRLTRTVEPW